MDNTSTKRGHVLDVVFSGPQREQVVSVLREHGEVAGAAMLGVSRATLLRAAAGMHVRRGSALSIRAALESMSSTQQKEKAALDALR